MNAQQQFAQKVTAGIFNPIKRHLSVTATENDRFEEGVAQTWRFYSQRVAEGNTPPDAILVHHAKLRATDMNRTLVGADGRHRKCPLDPRTYSRGKAELCVFDEGVHAEIGCSNPEPKMVSALDLESWLGTLPTKDRQILSGRIAGNTLKEIAKQVGMSFSGVNGRLKKLGQELAERMEMPAPQAA